MSEDVAVAIMKSKLDEIKGAFERELFVLADFINDPFCSGPPNRATLEEVFKIFEKYGQKDHLFFFNDRERLRHIAQAILHMSKRESERFDEMEKLFFRYGIVIPVYSRSVEVWEPPEMPEPAAVFKPPKGKSIYDVVGSVLKKKVAHG